MAEKSGASSVTTWMTRALKPYFELHKVLQDGVFLRLPTGSTASPSSRARTFPVYHPDVMVYEVFEQDGSSLGLMYFDLFQARQTNPAAPG